ncbi:hypothetical protein BDZ89DRAFT_827174 [Hymenopellis radicata]|nr:hypothetical protein BDZ89DRAFT_827174 [Hymenopellis radicata]
MLSLLFNSSILPFHWTSNVRLLTSCPPHGSSGLPLSHTHRLVVGFSPVTSSLWTIWRPTILADSSLNISAENFPQILRLVDKIGDIGKNRGATPGHTALAWILAQGRECLSYYDRDLVPVSTYLPTYL